MTSSSSAIQSEIRGKISSFFSQSLLIKKGELADYLKNSKLRNLEEVISESQLRWLKTLSSTFHDVDFDVSVDSSIGMIKLPNNW